MDWLKITTGIILDIMMPKRDGLEVLKALRAQGVTTPVLFLTAKSEIADRIQGLDIGADDYLTKPFAMGELLARIRAMTRRKDAFQPQVLTLGNVTLDRGTFELKGPAGGHSAGQQRISNVRDAYAGRRPRHFRRAVYRAYLGL